MYFVYNVIINIYILIDCLKYYKKVLFKLYKLYLMLFERGWKLDLNGVIMMSCLICGNNEWCLKLK